MSSGGYSARVRIELRVNGQRLRVAKIGPDRLYLDAPQTLSASTGEVVMHIDGRERRWRVALHPRGGVERVVPAEFASD
jgi:hypothetical protein